MLDNFDEENDFVEFFDIQNLYFDHPLSVEEYDELKEVILGFNNLSQIYFKGTCDLDSIEADTFWSFSLLMEDIKKHFININDKKKGGICDKVNLFELMVSKIHKDIFIKFQNNKIRIFQFAFRWINLFFSQQFILPDLIRIWDAIFCENDRYYFTFYLGLAILEYKKNGLLSKKFFDTVEELQKKELADVNKIMKIAFEIKKSNENIIKEESIINFLKI